MLRWVFGRAYAGLVETPRRKRGTIAPKTPKETLSKI